MATPQRFEGASIEEVLGRVRAQLGTDAEIIEANKVRSGGIGGFFSKESFEVLALPVHGPTTPPAPARASGGGRTVGPMLQARQPAPAVASPLTDGAASRSAQAATDAPVSLLDMAERVSAAETADTDDVPAPSGLHAAPQPAPRSRAQHVAEQVMAEHLRQMGTQPHGRVDPADFQPLQPAEMPRISTEGNAFTEVLQRIAHDAGHEIAHAVEGQSAASMPPFPTMAGTMSVSERSGTPVGPVMRQMAAEDAAHAQIITSETTPLARGIAEQTITGYDDVAAGSADEADTGVAPDVASDIASAVAQNHQPSDRLPVPQQQELEVAQSRTERLLSWLELDHLPPTTLISALRSLPQMEALPQTRGVVVAVVGERSRALRLCRQLARACHSDPRDVVLASPSYRGSAIPEEQRIIDLTDATRDRRGWVVAPPPPSWRSSPPPALTPRRSPGPVRSSRRWMPTRSSAWSAPRARPRTSVPGLT